MEEYLNRRPRAEIGYPRRGSRIPLRNQCPEERTSHNNDGPGSSTRHNPMKSRMADNQERPRYLYDSFKSSSSKVVPASSSSFPLTKFDEEKQKQSFFPGVRIAESSRRKAEAKPVESNKQIVVEHQNSDTVQTELEGFSSGQGRLLAPDPYCSHFADSRYISRPKVGPSVRSAPLCSRTHRLRNKEVNLGAPGACSSSLSDRPTVPDNSAIGVKPSYGDVSGVRRRGLKNLASTSVPGVLPSGCPSDSAHNRRFEAMRKRASDGEGSSRSRCLSEAAGLGHSSPTYLRDTAPTVRTIERPLSQQIIRSSSRNHQDSAVSVRTRRSSPQSTRLRLSEGREDHMLSLHDSSTMQQSDQPLFSFEEVSSERSISPFSVELPHEIYSSRRHGQNIRTANRRPSSPFEESPPQMLYGVLEERDNHRHITMEAITEVLVALERIEQQAELTYEQLLVLETNLFLGAFSSHDQHRNMRMDIDNMSYEELLALEERIGSVSTALSEEQLTKCLRRSIYSPVAAAGVNKTVVDDIKCSICQEEYTAGEEVGRLPCEHQYHVRCIGQWLREKNWCPVCRASVAPSMK